MYKGTKKARVIPVSAEDEKESKPMDRELFMVLLNIQEKLNSPVFNGGFETMMSKVDGIEKRQHEMLSHMNDLNKTIYEPDEGLFSRIKNVNQDVHELSQWKLEMAEKAKEHDKAVDVVNDLAEWKKETDSKLKEQATYSDDVKKLTSWKGKFDKILWWFVPAIGGLLLKAAWELLKNHISLR